MLPQKIRVGIETKRILIHEQVFLLLSFIVQYLLTLFSGFELAFSETKYNFFSGP